MTRIKALRVGNVYIVLRGMINWIKRLMLKTCAYDVEWVKKHMYTELGKVVADRVSKWACEVRSVDEVLYALLSGLRASGAELESLYGLDDHRRRPRDVTRDLALAVAEWLSALVDAGLLYLYYVRVGDDGRPYTGVELWHGPRHRRSYVEVRIYVGEWGLEPRLVKACSLRGSEYGGPFC